MEDHHSQYISVSVAKGVVYLLYLDHTSLESHSSSDLDPWQVNEVALGLWDMGHVIFYSPDGPTKADSCVFMYFGYEWEDDYTLAYVTDDCSVSTGNDRKPINTLCTKRSTGDSTVFSQLPHITPRLSSSYTGTKKHWLSHFTLSPSHSRPRSSPLLLAIPQLRWSGHIFQMPDYRFPKWEAGQGNVRRPILPFTLGKK